MATTFVEYTGDGNATKSFSFPSYQETDVKVRVDGVLKTRLTHYNITSYTTTGGGNVVFTSGNIPSSPAKIRIYRDTDVDAAKATYTAGSSVKAADLNNNNTQLLYRAQEEQVPNLIQSYDIASDAIETSNIKDASVTTDKIADSNVTTAKIADSNVTTAKIADNAVTMAKLNSGALPTDITVASANIVDGTIVEADIANSAVTQNKLANNSVGTPELINGSVTTDKIANDNVTLAKLGGGALPTDITVASANIVNGTIVTADIGNDQITNAKIADNSVNADKLGSAAVTTAKILNGAVTGSKLAQNSVGNNALNTNAVATENIQNNAVTAAKIADEVIVTSSEQASHSVDNSTFFTTAAAEARYFNASTGETIKDGQAFPDNDTTIATTAAINDRIIDLVDDVGGFVPIANETSFPTANPDVNNGSGTLVSVKAISSTRTPSSGTVTIANGAGTGNTVTITGCGSTVLTAGFGIIVETTSTLHTYAFHRLVPKATEVTTVAGISSNVTTVATNIADINTVAADLNESTSEIDTVATNIANVNNVGNSIANVNTTAGSIANVNTTAGSITNVNNVGNNISNVNAVAGNASNINSAVSNASNINSAVSNASNINTVAGSISNVNTTAGSISNVNTVASNINNVNSFFNTYRIGSSNPTTSLDTGDLFFNTTSNSLKVYTGSAWVDGVTATGNFALKTGNTFTGTNNHNDNVKSIYGNGNDLQIYHNGSHSFVQDTGTGSLKLAGADVQVVNADNSAVLAQFISGGKNELRFDNSTKLETTSGGVSVTGSATISSGQPALYLTDTTDNPDFSIKNADGVFRIIDETNSVARFNVLQTGTVDIAGNLDVYGGIDIPADSQKLRLGASQDLELYHDGTLSYIKNNTAKLVLRSDTFQFGTADGTHRYIDIPTDEQGVDLYYDNSKKFNTRVNGIQVQGRIIFDDDTNTYVQHGSSGDEIELVTGSNTRLKVDGHVRNPNDNSFIFVGAGNDLGFTHDGTDSKIKNNTGELKILANNVQFKTKLDDETLADFNANGAAELYYDNSKKFETSSSGATVTGRLVSDGLDVGDSESIRFGTGYDMVAYHDGTNGVINNTTGNLYIIGSNGNILLRPSTDDEHGVVVAANAQVELYYNGGKRFETSNNGANLYGTLLPSADASYNLGSTGARWGTVYATDFQGSGANLTGINTDLVSDTTPQLGGSLDTNAKNINFGDSNGSTNQARFGAASDLKIYHNGSSSFIAEEGTGSLKLTTNGTGVDIQKGTTETIARFVADGAVQLYYDNSNKLETNSGGVEISGHLVLGDNRYVKLGSGTDVQIFHNGSNFHIQHVTSGSLYMDSVGDHNFRNIGGTEYRARFDNNGSVKLYYDGGEKLRTTANGVHIVDNFLGVGTSVITPTGSPSSRNAFLALGDSDTGMAQNGDGQLEAWANNQEIMNFSTGDITSYKSIIPSANDTHTLGSNSNRWSDIYTNDLHLSNEGSSNDMDGTWGDWTIQEGESDLFLKNNRSGKKYKFNLMEVS